MIGWRSDQMDLKHNSVPGCEWGRREDAVLDCFLPLILYRGNRQKWWYIWNFLRLHLSCMDGKKERKGKEVSQPLHYYNPGSVRARDAKNQKPKTKHQTEPWFSRFGTLPNHLTNEIIRPVLKMLNIMTETMAHAVIPWFSFQYNTGAGCRPSKKPNFTLAPPSSPNKRILRPPIQQNASF